MTQFDRPYFHLMHLYLFPKMNCLFTETKTATKWLPLWREGTDVAMLDWPDIKLYENKNGSWHKKMALLFRFLAMFRFMSQLFMFRSIFNWNICLSVLLGQGKLHVSLASTARMPFYPPHQKLNILIFFQYFAISSKNLHYWCIFWLQIVFCLKGYQ